MKKLKINYLLKYWNYLNFLRINGIFIFCQNLSLNAKKDLEISRYLKNFNYEWKNLNKNFLKFFLDKNFFIKIKKFNDILIIHNIQDIIKIQNYLKENNIIILGYYMQNIFFFKKDFNIKKIEKKNIINELKKRILNFSIKKSIASFQLTGSKAASLARRIIGEVPRFLVLLATHACSPFGPRWPKLTGWSAMPRTPTIFPSFTAISIPQPLEHKMQAECTQLSGWPCIPRLISILGSIQCWVYVRERSAPISKCINFLLQSGQDHFFAGSRQTTASGVNTLKVKDSWI